MQASGFLYRRREPCLIQPPMAQWLPDLLLLAVVFSSLLHLVLSTDPPLSPKGVNSEVVALMLMKSMMRDETGVMGGWDINSVDPCTWTMVGCSPNGLVISLDMANNGLSGTLSASVGNLSHLQTMLLQNNKITGPLPVEIGKLSQLKTLDLSDNQFAGQIPGSLGLLTHLGYLRLDRNNFSGPIPEAVAQLAGLTFLDLSFNNLSGPIPMISAKDYSVAGNYFLCNSSTTRGCANGSVVVNEPITSGKSSNHHLAVAVSLSVICVLILFVLMLFCWLHRCRWRLPFASADKKYEFGMGQLKRFSFRELQVATDNFSTKNILGQGGFGVVYKGVLRNGTVVAVKRLKDPNFTGEVQFQTEVEMIGLALHRNVLCLYGFCMTSNDRLLIYPYMPNGSVADRLRDHNNGVPSLDWNKRMRIALGAARGLLYLHEQCNPRIIHRDVKAANILLDENYEAIVGDFGLAKLLDRRDSHVTTAVRGTVGHIAPEYLSTGQSSEKTDVFGFGVLLLEMITGQKTLCSGNGNTQKGVILEWVRELYEEKRLHSMVDRKLNGFFIAAELENAVEVILLCTQSNPSIRPTMCEVVKALEKARPAEQQVEESHEVLQGTSCSLSRFHDDINEASSFVIEPIELSGPR
ncbi:probable LRR receptor-like serine/threonine-protein kinase At5g45780 [Dendrobium catenatum]|uniref:non-specific serine/threonine protein kinase n=1 Tax=Dendrobium catenatum TaxID=906689 RepID=A0A2I0XE49_9ASPA|nr:probable LRR receptor-like serine/threonine-protein kinase At5g45780 [Dendrobium catenatum]PKU86185.1 putative LRR receptor-like serine/threonine-protein kinase [Dendrobium catenatum]